jgi:hypothetical protein
MAAAVPYNVRIVCKDILGGPAERLWASEEGFCYMESDLKKLWMGEEYCDVHAAVLFRGSKERYLVTARQSLMDVSLESVPRKCFLYGLTPG